MSFAAVFLLPKALPLVFGAVAVAFVVLGLERRRAREIARVVRSDVASRTRTALPLLLTALVLTALALAQPTWGSARRAVERRGIEVCLCLDVSNSMLAEDVSPSRLGAARKEIAAFAEHARGDRIGLVAFAGDARLMTPLTTDVFSLTKIAEDTDRLAVKKGGTDLGLAIDLARTTFSDEAGVRAIIVMTDGEDNEGRGRAAAERARADGAVVHTVGFGSARGAKITIVEDQKVEYLKDRGGADVLSTMDETSLRKIADVGGGEFALADASNTALRALYDRVLLPQAKAKITADGELEPVNRFQWPLVPAVLLLLLHGVMSRSGKR